MFQQQNQQYWEHIYECVNLGETITNLKVGIKYNLWR